MAQYTGLQERIKEVIRPNGVGAITAADHQALLLEVVDTLGHDINKIGEGAVKPDGKYPELTTGFANNLVGRGEAIEAEIDFRPSGGKSIEDGVARVKELRGNTIVVDGAFLSCKADAIKSVNDNAWDEEWEKGYINNTNGYEQDSEYYIRSKNYNRILAGETYYLKGDNCSIVLYDENKQYLDYWSIPTEGRTIVVDSRARYFKFAFSDAYGTKYKDNVIVSLYHSGYKEGQYIPHKEFIREFDRRIKNEFPNGIKMFDKVYNKNGKGYILKGTGEVDMGSLSWGYFNGAFYAAVPNKADGRLGHSDVIAEYYTAVSGGGSQAGQNGNIWSEAGTTNVYVKDASYADVANFTRAMQGITLYYELAEPIIIEYNEPFNLDYEVWDFGTEEMLASEPSAPIRAQIAYGFNAVDEIRELRQMLATLQAQIANL